MKIMHYFKLVACLCVLAALFMNSSGSVSASFTCGGWSVVPSSNNGPYTNSLNGVAAVSASDVWAVGSYFYNNNYLSGTLTEQWNGTGWSIITSPNVGSLYNSLNGVTAVSASNIWAVGLEQTSQNVPIQTLIEHWDGSSWSVVPSPNVGSQENRLAGVAAVSANDVWTVGVYFNNNGLEQTLIEHWNGTEWNIVKSPNPGAAVNDLYGVAAVSASNIWAVGDFENSSGVLQTLTEHWNGKKWSVVPSPSLGTYDSLGGVATVSKNNVWAVGNYSNDGNYYQTLTEHWNGTKWSVVSSPNAGIADNYLLDVAVVSVKNIWAVGWYLNADNYIQTLTEQWNGTDWSIVPSPNPGSGGNILHGVAAVPSNIWAVGWYNDFGGYNQTLTEFYC